MPECRSDGWDVYGYERFGIIAAGIGFGTGIDLEDGQPVSIPVPTAIPIPTMSRPG